MKDDETAKRRDAALRRALMTPPKPHNAVTGAKRKTSRVRSAKTNGGRVTGPRGTK